MQRENNEIMSLHTEYMVCIICTTFNHERFIADALEGFVHQQTSFRYCAVIIDDCSTDQTSNIIRQYEEKYPDIVKGVYLKENHYSQKKTKIPYIQQWCKKCKYFAMCEGDDYWIDRHKLQKQVSFLEANPNYQLVFHNAIIHSEEQLWPDRIMCDFPTGDLGIKEVFEYWQLPYASVLVRSSLYEHPVFMDLNKKVQGGWNLFIAAALVGKVYGFSECMSVYRKNTNGLSARMTLDFVIKANYRYAYAVGHPDAILAIDAKTQKMLCRHYRAFLSGDPEVRKAMATAKEYNKHMPLYVLFDYILHLPEKIYRRLHQKVSKSNIDYDE